MGEGRRDAADDDAAVHELTLVHPDASTDKTTAAADQTLLSAVRTADIQIQSGCERGRCSTCTGRLLDGEIEYCRPPRALSDDHRTAGFVLLCSAMPRAACRIEIGTHVREEAFPELWGAWD